MGVALNPPAAIRPHFLLSSLFVLIAGLAQALSIATPWNGEPVWWLQILSLAVLAWQLMALAGGGYSDKTWLHAAALGWLFATAWLAGTWWWLFISLHVYGGLPSVLAVIAVLALAGALSLYYAAACGVFYKLYSARASVRWSFVALIFTALWTLAELARARWFTGFPWGMGGYAHTSGPLAPLAPWLGAYGIGGLAAWLAVMLAAMAQRQQRRHRTGEGFRAQPDADFGTSEGPSRGTRFGTAALIALALLLPQGLRAVWPSFSQDAGSLQVALLQGNIAQHQKFQPRTGIADALNWYGSALMENRAALVVTPETAIPLLPAQLPDGYWAALQVRYAQGEQAALIGVPLGSRQEGYTNAVVGLRPGQGAPYTYDKHHLVPFGEFVPPFFRWFLDLMNIPLGDFNRGPLAAPSFDWQGQRLAPNICYEDLFGEELGARFVDPAVAPTMFVNVSNIAWFGNTLAIDQHLQISRMRALEFERPMLRATNTGATAIINYRGEVTHSLPRHTRGVLTGDAQGRNGITPFAYWTARWGLWPLWLLALGVVAVAVLRARGRRH